jgi:hypothetical protein
MSEQHPHTASDVEREYQPRHLWELNRGKLSTDQKRIAREEIWEANMRDCSVCHLQIRKDELHLAVDIDHLVGKLLPGRNLLPMMRLAHHNCNARKGMPQTPIASPIQKVRERELGRVQGEYSSVETWKHYTERPAWNLMIYKKPDGLMAEQGAKFPYEKLYKKAPGLIGEFLFTQKLARTSAPYGSSITYHRYQDEDIEAGYLQIGPELGNFVERTAKPFPFEETERP